MDEEKTINVSREATVEALDKIINIGTLVATFAAPVLFLPLTVDWYEFNKQIFLVILLGFLAVVHLFRSVLTQKLVLRKSVFDLPVYALLVCSVITSFLTGNRELTLYSALMFFLPSTIIFALLANSQKFEESFKKTVTGVMTGLTVVSVLTIVQNLLATIANIPNVGVSIKAITNPTSGNMIANLVAIILSPLFSPVGSVFAQTLFIAAVLPIAIYVMVRSQKIEAPITKIMMTSPLILGLVALVLSVIRVFSNRPVLLDLTTGWRIAARTMGDSLTSALLGVGNNNFINAFTINKPVEFNATNLWNLRFSTSSDFPLFLLTTGGIAAFSAFAVLVWKFFKTAKSRLGTDVASPVEKALLAVGGIALGLMIIFPVPFIVIFVLYTALGLLVAYYQSKGTTIASESKAGWLGLPAAGYIALGIGVIAFGFTAFRAGQIFVADYYFNQALVAASANRGADTYNMQIKAIKLAPWNDTYQVSYSQTNLALADALAGQAKNGALTDQQKSTILQLVQQAIGSARNGVALNPARAANWENLTAIYRSLISFAQGADQWAVTSQNQAIALDPVNPRLRLDLGGIFFGLGNYQAAGQAFSLATSLKGDYANAHYNLAQAAKMVKDYSLAASELTTTKNLVCNLVESTNPQLSADCQRVQGELDQLKAEVAEPVKSATTAAQAATPAAKPVVKPTTQVTPIATASGAPTNLSKTPVPGAQITSPSGQLKP